MMPRRRTYTLFEELHDTLTDAQLLRGNRPGHDPVTMEPEWVRAERLTMLEAVNRRRVAAGRDPVTEHDILTRAEQRALGHSDYTRQYAHGCVALVEQEDPS